MTGRNRKEEEIGEEEGGGRPRNERVGEMAQSVKCLLCKLSVGPSTHVQRLDMVIHRPVSPLLGTERDS